MASARSAESDDFYINTAPWSQSHIFFSLCIAFIVIDAIAFFLRTWSRYVQRTKWTEADVLMPLSLMFNIGVCVCGLLEVRYSWQDSDGRLSSVQASNWITVAYYATPTIYLLAVVWPRLAILDIYLHFFPDRNSRLICYVTGAIIVLNCIVNIILTYFPCKFWESSYDSRKPGICIDTTSHTTWEGFPNILTDVIMLALPLPLIISLSQSTATRIFIFIIFLVGNAGLAASLARFIEFYTQPSISNTHIISFEDEIWTIIEPSIYHLTACFIAYRPLINWWLSHLSLSSSTTNASSQHSSEKEIDISRQSSTREPRDSQASTNVSSLQHDQQGCLPPTSNFNLPSNIRDKISRPFSNSRIDDLRAASIAGAGGLNGNRPGSSGFITVSREFHVRHGVDPTRLEPGVRSSLRERDDGEGVPDWGEPPMV